MFGSIGPSELLLIFIIALLVFGPKKLPDIGKSVGKALREFKKASEEIKGRIEEEIQASELKDIHKDVKSGLDTLQSGVRGFQDRIKQTMGLNDLTKSPPVVDVASSTASPYEPVPEIPSGAENPTPGSESAPSGPESDPYATLVGKDAPHDIPSEADSLQVKIKKETTKNETGEGRKVS